MTIKPILIGAASGALVFGLAMAPAVKAVQAALVNVANTAASPVPTRMTDKLNGYGTRVFPNARTSTNIEVPAGKYFVITSITGFNNGGLASDLAVDAIVNGGGIEQRIPFHRPQVNGIWYLEAVPTEIVADPGSRITFYINGAPSTDGAGYNIDVRGYYIPAN
jgi:hypothetical protein